LKSVESDSISNSREVIESIPEDERAGSVRQIDLEHLPIERVLGVQWNVESDVFGFKIVVKIRPSTRRGLLSVVSTVYDPLGFLSPFLLKAKAILQSLSRKGLDWDDPIPPEDQEQWRSWLEQLATLRSLL
jgi:hypothetical protein